MKIRIRIVYLVLFVMCFQLHFELQQPGLEERDADEETGERGGRGSQRAVRMIIMIKMETMIVIMINVGAMTRLATAETITLRQENILSAGTRSL